MREKQKERRKKKKLEANGDAGLYGGEEGREMKETGAEKENRATEVQKWGVRLKKKQGDVPGDNRPKLKSGVAGNSQKGLSCLFPSPPLPLTAACFSSLAISSRGRTQLMCTSWTRESNL